MNNIDDPDYIERRDELLKFIHKQNLLWEMGFKDENTPGKPRGRKPAPSKRIAKVDHTKKRNRYQDWDD
jgi:hypothetical protein